MPDPREQQVKADSWVSKCDDLAVDVSGSQFWMHCTEWVKSTQEIKWMQHLKNWAGGGMRGEGEWVK